MNYDQFIESKSQLSGNFGFDPIWMPDFLFDFQKCAVEWALKKGRFAGFFDCGLGKSPMALVCAENVIRKTNGRFLFIMPLAVCPQMKREADKFGIEVHISRDGKLPTESKIILTNYEKLHLFNSTDFIGAACDESSIIKNFDGQYKEQITEFMRTLKYRHLWTATPSPNDYVELGTTSECLGDLGYMDMLGRFFKNSQNSLHPSVYRNKGKLFQLIDDGAKWRFRGHAERDFWRWVCSWAKACRKPSDLGFSDNDFILPPLNIREHVVKSTSPNPDFLFDMPAVSLDEQRKERRRTLRERCELAASFHSVRSGQSVAWCFLNDEGDMLEEMIPDCVQVAGKDSDEEKEEKFEAFRSGQAKRMVTKGDIAGFGINWQFADYFTYFPNHSFELWYQCMRRLWRFGQKNTVSADVIISEGEIRVLENLKRKSDAAELMFSKLVALMNNEMQIKTVNKAVNNQQNPLWL